MNSRSKQNNTLRASVLKNNVQGSSAGGSNITDGVKKGEFNSNPDILLIPKTPENDADAKTYISKRGT
jgi:hypothetical protein